MSSPRRVAYLAPVAVVAFATAFVVAVDRSAPLGATAAVRNAPASAGHRGGAPSAGPAAAAAQREGLGWVGAGLMKFWFTMHGGIPRRVPVPSAAPSPTDPATPSPAGTVPSSPDPMPSDPGGSSPVPSDPGAPGPSVRPDASNTGVPAGTVLTRYDGNLVITQAGTVLDGLDVHGFVNVKADDVVIRDSIIRGGQLTPGRTSGLVNAYFGARNLTVIDSELVPEFPSVGLDGIKGWNYTAVRVNIHGTVDNAKVFGDDTTIMDSYLHDTVPFAHDPAQHGGPSHNDNVQVLSGRNVRIVRNSLSGSTNAGLQVTQDHGAVSGLVFQDNWADGGGCTVNLSNKGQPSLSDVAVLDNRFGHGQAYRGCAIVMTQAVSPTLGGNVWDDSAAPVDVVHRAK